MELGHGLRTVAVYTPIYAKAKLQTEFTLFQYFWCHVGGQFSASQSQVWPIHWLTTTSQTAKEEARTARTSMLQTKLD